LHLDLENVPQGEPYKLVEIQPVVLFGMLDHYLRRNESQDRVIGALLGSIDNGVVQVTNCFTVPHTEKEQVAIDIQYYYAMVKLHAEVASHEQIVGWYSTSVRESSVLMHDFFWKEMNEHPVHMVIDPQTFQRKGSTFGVNVFYNAPVGLGERNCQNQFRPLKHVIKSDQADRIIMQRLIAEKDKKDHAPLSDLDSLEKQVKEIIDMVDSITLYVRRVSRGEVKGDPKIARLIEQTLAILPSVDSEGVKKLFTKGVQDLLMVVYLAKLTRTHLLLAEKLRDVAPKTDSQAD